MGAPEIRYGDSLCFVQHVDTKLWLTYQTGNSSRQTESVSQRQVSLTRRSIALLDGTLWNCNMQILKVVLMGKCFGPTGCFASRRSYG